MSDLELIRSANPRRTCMKPRIKPRPGYGPRNHFCRNYTRCLDRAIAKCWENWRCTDCAFNSSEHCSDERFLPMEEVFEFQVTAGVSL